MRTLERLPRQRPTRRGGAGYLRRMVGARDRRPTRRPLPPGGARSGRSSGSAAGRRDDGLRRGRAAGPSGRRRSRPGSRGSHQAFFRSALAGQANAILVRPASRATISGTRGSATPAASGGSSTRCACARNDARRRNLHASERLRTTPLSRAGGSRGHTRFAKAVRAPERPSCSRATSTSPTRTSTATRRRARGSTTCSCAARRSGTSRSGRVERRMQNGVVLSDHAPVDCVLEVAS